MRNTALNDCVTSACVAHARLCVWLYKARKAWDGSLMAGLELWKKEAIFQLPLTPCWTKKYTSDCKQYNVYSSGFCSHLSFLKVQCRTCDSLKFPVQVKTQTLSMHKWSYELQYIFQAYGSFSPFFKLVFAKIYQWPLVSEGIIIRNSLQPI